MNTDGKYSVSSDVATAALDGFLGEDGVFDDLCYLVNAPVSLLKGRPEYGVFREYMDAKVVVWDEPSEQMLGNDGTEIVRRVGHCTSTPTGPKHPNPQPVTRKYKRAVNKLMKDALPKIAEALEKSLKFVMPPTTEEAQIDFLRAQSKKQTSPSPPPKIRGLLGGSIFFRSLRGSPKVSYHKMVIKKIIRFPYSSNLSLTS